MNTNFNNNVLTIPLTQPIRFKISKRSAVHKAGHTAGIYFWNKQTGSPPVKFRIGIHHLAPQVSTSKFSKKNLNKCLATLEGGRFVSELPMSITEATNAMSDHERLAYEQKFTADIINLLSGPIAEARYVALRDDEVISPRLVNIHALRFYGGNADMELIFRYFDCFKDAYKDKERKITEIYLRAYAFVIERSNWLAIMALADYITAAEKTVIEYEEIISVLEAHPITNHVMH